MKLAAIRSLSLIAMILFSIFFIIFNFTHITIIYCDLDYFIVFLVQSHCFPFSGDNDMH